MLSAKDLAGIGSLIDKEATAEAQTDVHEDYIIEQLDYGYVKDCSNPKELRTILRVLKYSLS
jgi:hypothetical protein